MPLDVSPEKQNLDNVFASTTYHIDFYQRDYRWTEEPVKRLLDDIFFKFNEEYAVRKGSEPSPELVDKHYPWYYLNTYVTNTVDGKVFVVDGQQRLTTLSLITMKLLHLAKEHSSRLDKWIDSKIAGVAGFESTFWMNHVGHEKAQQAIYSGDIEDADTSSGITAVNMKNNYITISKWLDKQLPTQHKFETFTLYFLKRLVLINLSVEQTDVPMVFEVINDRGVRLKPFEIIKGKLLGQIDKVTLEKKAYNELWEDHASAINKFEEDGFDDFFRYWLKARFANTRGEGQRYDGDYHREMFSNKFEEHMSLSHNQTEVMKFLDGEFTYYASVYEKLMAAYYDEQNVSPIIYNRVVDIDGAFMLLLSSCKINDTEEAEKLTTIPTELDRFYTLLQLQGVYDSNAFQEALFKISAEIRDKGLESVRSVFDSYLKAEIERRRQTTVSDPFQYIYFKQTGINLNARFKRYFFARVEEFLASNLKASMRHPLTDLVQKTGAVNGFHIEHILAHNSQNLAAFNDDEERFEQERNRLGGILLLKGKDNISSNNEVYSKKLNTYASTLLWNETLLQDTYQSNLDLKALKDDMKLDLKAVPAFGPVELEERQLLLFKICQIVWG
jgi:uncharacterized protein DUF262/uncharacterized protein DUF1524